MKSLSTTQSAEKLVSRQEKQQSVRKVRSRSRKNASNFLEFCSPFILGVTYFSIFLLYGVSYLAFPPHVQHLHLRPLSAYRTILHAQDPEFTGALGTFTIFAIFIVPTTFIFSLGLALLVNSIKFGRGFFRSVFFLPTACLVCSGLNHLENEYLQWYILWSCKYCSWSFSYRSRPMDIKSHASLVLGSTGDSTPLASGRYLYDYFHCRSARYSTRTLRSRYG